MVAPNKKAAKWLLLVLVLAGGIGGPTPTRTVLEALYSPVQLAACNVLFSPDPFPLWNGSGIAVGMCFLFTVIGGSVVAHMCILDSRIEVVAERAILRYGYMHCHFCGMAKFMLLNLIT